MAHFIVIEVASITDLTFNKGILHQRDGCSFGVLLKADWQKVTSAQTKVASSFNIQQRRLRSTFFSLRHIYCVVLRCTRSVCRYNSKYFSFSKIAPHPQAPTVYQVHLQSISNQRSEAATQNTFPYNKQSSGSFLHPQNFDVNNSRVIKAKIILHLSNTSPVQKYSVFSWLNEIFFLSFEMHIKSNPNFILETF